MGDHLVLYVDRLITASSFTSTANNMLSSAAACAKSPKEVSSSSSSVVSAAIDSYSPPPKPKKDVHCGEDGESEIVECRICQEEDLDNNMEIPCACSGSMKYAHRSCVQRWCNEKGDTTCEICQQAYRPGYTAPPRPITNGVTVDISGNWEFNDPRLIAMAAAERHLLEDYEDCPGANSSCATCSRSALLILMALLLLRHALAISSAAGDEDFSTFFTLFLLRAAGFLLPCYIMARAMNVIQRRRQRQEAAMTAAEVAFLLEAGRSRGLRFTARSVPAEQ